MTDSLAGAAPVRVALWGTGNVGRQALRGIVDHPELELAAVIVHDPAKAGVDAGVLCGYRSVGISTTTDASAALTGVDVLCYAATAERRARDAVNEMAGALEKGVHVVSTSYGALVYPPAAPANELAVLAAACERGGTTFLTSGLDPGYSNDLLPMSLSACSRRIDRMRTQEIFDYSTYAQPEFLFEILGFGQALDHTPPLLRPGVLTKTWGPVVHLSATALGVTLDEIVVRSERRTFDEPIHVGSATIEVGTAAALRFELVGLIDGHERVTVEHVTRMHRDAAPDWPRSVWRGCYRIHLEGDPNIVCEFGVASDDENGEWLLVTAMRVVNAIPAVVRARPGVISVLDLPMFGGRGLASTVAAAAGTKQRGRA